MQRKLLLAVAVIALYSGANASPLKGNFENDVIDARRKAVTSVSACACQSTSCTFNTGVSPYAAGTCTGTLTDGATCVAACASGYTMKTGQTGTVTCNKGIVSGPGTVFQCLGKECAVSANSDLMTSTTGATIGTCAAAVTAKKALDGDKCTFSCDGTKYKAQSTATTCSNGVITKGACQVATCDFGRSNALAAVTGTTWGTDNVLHKASGGCANAGALGSKCTPACKAGYTQSGECSCAAQANNGVGVVTCTGVTCTKIPNDCSTDDINNSGFANVASVSWTAPTGGTTPTGTTVGQYAGKLSSGGVGTFTCKTGYTPTATLTCTGTVGAGVVKAGKCSKDCTRTAAVPTNGQATTGCTDQTTNIASGKTCTPTGKAGYTCTPMTCVDGTVTESTCAKTTCNCAKTALAAGTTAGTCSTSAAQGSTCQPGCKTGYSLQAAASLSTCGTTGACPTTAVCVADSCTITNPTNGNGGCGAVANAGKCTPTCNTGYGNPTGLQNECKHGVVSCEGCHTNCAPGKCVTANSDSTCTACFNDGYTLTANKFQSNFGKCMLKVITESITTSQSITFPSQTAASYTGALKTNTEGRYAKAVVCGGTTASGCTGTSKVTSRRAGSTVTFTLSIDAAHAANILNNQKRLTVAKYNAVTGFGGTAVAGSIGGVTVNAAGSTSIATGMIAAVMFAGLFWSQ